MTATTLRRKEKQDISRTWWNTSEDGDTALLWRDFTHLNVKTTRRYVATAVEYEPAAMTLCMKKLRSELYQVNYKNIRFSLERDSTLCEGTEITCTRRHSKQYEEVGTARIAYGEVETTSLMTLISWRNRDCSGNWADDTSTAQNHFHKKILQNCTKWKIGTCQRCGKIPTKP